MENHKLVMCFNILLKLLPILMRNLIFFMHTSLDGIVAGLNGELDWLKLDEDMPKFLLENAICGYKHYKFIQKFQARQNLEYYSISVCFLVKQYGIKQQVCILESHL